MVCNNCHSKLTNFIFFHTVSPARANFGGVESKNHHKNDKKLKKHEKNPTCIVQLVRQVNLRMLIPTWCHAWNTPLKKVWFGCGLWDTCLFFFRSCLTPSTFMSVMVSLLLIVSIYYLLSQDQR